MAKLGLARGVVGPAGDGLGLKCDARDDRIVEDATVEIELATIVGLRAGGETGEAMAAEEFFPGGMVWRELAREIELVGEGDAPIVRWWITRALEAPP